jgi:hypothetical protein
MISGKTYYIYRGESLNISTLCENELENTGKFFSQGLISIVDYSIKINEILQTELLNHPENLSLQNLLNKAP